MQERGKVAALEYQLKLGDGVSTGSGPGSPRGVLDATGSQRITRIVFARSFYPVATARGTDLIRSQVGRYSNSSSIIVFQRRVSMASDQLADC